MAEFAFLQQITHDFSRGAIHDETEAARSGAVIGEQDDALVEVRVEQRRMGNEDAARKLKRSGCRFAHAPMLTTTPGLSSDEWHFRDVQIQKQDTVFKPAELSVSYFGLSFVNFHCSSKKPASTILPGNLSSGGTVVSTMAQSGSFGVCKALVPLAAARLNVKPLLSTM